MQNLYVTSSSLNSPGEPPMLNITINTSENFFLFFSILPMLYVGLSSFLL